MDNKQIKETLDQIIKKLNACEINAWNAHFDGTSSAIVIEDYYGDESITEPTARYNGWLDELITLKDSL